MGAHVEESGVPAAAELIAFTEAAVRGEDLDETRDGLVSIVGGRGAGQAAATVAAFSGLVRVADATGIPVDAGLAAASVSLRRDLALDSFGGAANTDLAGVVGAHLDDDLDDVTSLFSDIFGDPPADG